MAKSVEPISDVFVNLMAAGGDLKDDDEEENRRLRVESESGIDTHT